MDLGLFDIINSLLLVSESEEDYSTLKKNYGGKDKSIIIINIFLFKRFIKMYTI